MIRNFILIVVYLLLSTSQSYAQVVINEFSPVSNPEWVEFHNASSSAEYMKSYYIDDDTSFSDDAGSSSKRRLDELAGGVEYPTFDVSSFFNNDGDWVVLFNEVGTIVDQFQFSSHPGEDGTYGRSPNISGSFSLLSSRTKGSANSGPKASPVSTPTPAPTATPASTPEPTRYPTPTPVVKKSPVPTPRSSPDSSPDAVENENDILGIVSESSPVPLASAEVLGAKTNFNITGLLFIIGGIVLSGVGGLVTYKKTQQVN